MPGAVCGRVPAPPGCCPRDLRSPGAVTAAPRLCERHRRSLRRPYVACCSWRFSERSRSTSPSSSFTRARNARCFIRSRSGELRSAPLSAASRAFNVSTSLRSAAAPEVSARSALTSSCLARPLAQARSCNDRKLRAAQRSLTSSQRCASSCCCSATHREQPESFAGAATATAPTPPPAMTPCEYPVAIHPVYRNPESVSSDAAVSRCHYKSGLHATNERLRCEAGAKPIAGRNAGRLLELLVKHGEDSMRGRALFALSVLIEHYDPGHARRFLDQTD